jgi:NADH:ubiquinone oxidoreductase subunit 6 (subunit J)
MTLLAVLNWHAFFFMLFALVACVFALAVLFSSNIVRMAFYLVISLGATSGLFFLAGAEFVGAMQLMIYVGGTLVLLIFGVMLTAQRRFISLQTRAGDWVVAAALGGALLLTLTWAAVSGPEWSEAPDPERIPRSESKATTQIGLAFAGVRIDKAAKFYRARWAAEEGDVEILVAADGKLLEKDVSERPGQVEYRAEWSIALDQLPDSVRQTIRNEARQHKIERVSGHADASGYLLPFVIISVHLLVVLIGAAYMARAKKRAPQVARQPAA